VFDLSAGFGAALPVARRRSCLNRGLSAIRTITVLTVSCSWAPDLINQPEKE
jgi:hypothetical protein